MIRLLTFFTLVTSTPSDQFRGDRLIKLGLSNSSDCENVSYNDTLDSVKNRTPGAISCLTSASPLLSHSDRSEGFQVRCPPPTQGQGHSDPINLTCWDRSNDPTKSQGAHWDPQLQNRTCECWKCVVAACRPPSGESDTLPLAVGLGTCLGILVIALGAIVCRRLRRKRADGVYEDIVYDTTHVPSGGPWSIAPDRSPPTPPLLPPPPPPRRSLNRQCSSVSASGERTSGHSGANYRSDEMSGHLLSGHLFGASDRWGGPCDREAEPCDVRSLSMDEHNGMYREHEGACRGHNEVCYSRTGVRSGHAEVCYSHTGVRSGHAEVCRWHIEMGHGHASVCSGVCNGHVGKGSEYLEVFPDAIDTFSDCPEVCDCADCQDDGQTDDSVSRASIEAHVHTEPAICMLGLDPVGSGHGLQPRRFSQELSRRYSVRSRGSLMSLLKPKLSNGELFTSTLTSRETSVPRQERRTRTKSELP